MRSSDDSGRADAYDAEEIVEKTELANGVVSTVGSVAGSIYRYRAQQYNEAITAKRNEANERELQGDQQGADTLRKQAFQLALERDNPAISEASVNTLAEANTVQRADQDVTLYGHSWGSITTRNTLNILKERGYKNEKLGVQVFGSAVSPESIVEPMEAITGKGVKSLVKAKAPQILYYNDPDDFVASVVGGTAFGYSEYLDPNLDVHLPGSSQGDLWESTKAVPVIFKSGINPHSCYKNNCLGTQWNWTVEDASQYGLQQQARAQIPVTIKGENP